MSEPNNTQDGSRTIELLREVSELFSKDPEAKKHFSKLVMGVPDTSGSRPSYYGEGNAMELKPRLDEIITSREDIEFRFEDFPRLNRQTLYLKVYWAWVWLMEHADKEGRYRTLRNDTELSKRRSGVRITFVANHTALHAVKVKDISKPAFRTKIDDFLIDGKEGETLELTKISLSADEVANLKEMLTGIENLVWIVTGTRIKIMKVSPADYKKWVEQ